MSTILALPILLVVMMLQSVIISRLPLLSGSADLVLLVIVAWSLQERVPSAYEWAAMGGLMSGAITKLPFFIFNSFLIKLLTPYDKAINA